MTGSLEVVDLDTYRRGPSVNDMGRMFGATRFMAPEEFELGAVLDERTRMFTLGRLVRHFGTRLTERDDEFCGPPAVAQVTGASRVGAKTAARPPTAVEGRARWAGTVRALES